MASTSTGGVEENRNYALGLGFELYSSVDPHERERCFKKKFHNATSNMIL